MYCASQRGHLCVWKCNINTPDLVPRNDGEVEDEEDGEKKTKNDLEEGTPQVLFTL